MTLKVTDAFDLVGILLFYQAAKATDGPGSVLEMKANLLRIPNRPDLYPQAGIRVRLPDGSWTKHVFLPKANGVPDAQEPGTLIFKETIVTGFDQQVAVWAAAVTRDGVPSLLAGPRYTVTVPAPPVVPALTVEGTPGRDRATWAGPELGTTRR